MELILQTIQWWIIGFSGAAMPGPVTAYIVSETTRRGFIAGPLITIGHVLLELAMVMALFFGLRDVLNQNWVAGGIGIIGGLVLLWMGIDIVKSAWRGNLSLSWSASTPNSGVSHNPILGGIVTSIFNPYWYLWWATVGAAYLVTFRAFGIGGIIAFYFGHTLADWVWNNLVAFVVASGRQVLSHNAYRSILIVCGAFMIAMSVYFVSSGVNFLRG
jgi:threonine/homoserine/homoserine lactone efflux protein